jgi:hypothetical protein
VPKRARSMLKLLRLIRSCLGRVDFRDGDLLLKSLRDESGFRLTYVMFLGFIIKMGNFKRGSELLGNLKRIH